MASSNYPETLTFEQEWPATKECIQGAIESDCWGISIEKSGAIIPQYNTYALETDEPAWKTTNPNHQQWLQEDAIRASFINNIDLLFNQLEEDDKLHIHMFGNPWPWRIEVTKIDSMYVYKTYISQAFQEQFPEGTEWL